MRAAQQPYFFYGSLMDADIRRAVLGALADSLVIEAATLSGYRRVRSIGGTYPILLKAPRGRVNGLVVRGIKPPGHARLAYFEASEYRLVDVTVRCVGGRPETASVFLPTRAIRLDGPAWQFLEWQRRYKRPFLSRALAWMARFKPGK